MPLRCWESARLSWTLTGEATQNAHGECLRLCVGCVRDPPTLLRIVVAVCGAHRHAAVPAAERRLRRLACVGAVAHSLGFATENEERRVASVGGDVAPLAVSPCDRACPDADVVDVCTENFYKNRQAKSMLELNAFTASALDA